MAGIAGTQTVQDQHGAPVWGVPMRVGLRGSQPLNDPNTFHEQHVDRAGHVDVEYAARGFCAKTGRDFTNTLFTVHLNFNEGFNPDWQRYAQLSVDLDASSASASPIVLPRAGDPQPPLPSQFNPLDHSHVNIFETAREWLNGLVRKHGLSTISVQSLGVLKPELNAVGIKLQNNDRGDYRPRLHFPPADGNFFERNIDLGDFPGDGPNTTFGTVWEVRGWPDRWQ